MTILNLIAESVIKSAAKTVCRQFGTAFLAAAASQAAAKSVEAICKKAEKKFDKSDSKS